MWLVIGTGLWMKKWMKLFWQVAGAGEHSLSLNLIAAQMFSFLLAFSLLSNRPSKEPTTKETSEDWRAALFSACFRWWEKFWQNKRAHPLETEKRGKHPPSDCKFRVNDAGKFPSYPPAHRSYFPRRSLVSYGQRVLSNRGLPQNFYLWGLTERET